MIPIKHQFVTSLPYLPLSDEKTFKMIAEDLSLF